MPANQAHTYAWQAIQSSGPKPFLISQPAAQNEAPCFTPRDHAERGSPSSFPCRLLRLPPGFEPTRGTDPKLPFAGMARSYIRAQRPAQGSRRFLIIRR